MIASASHHIPRAEPVAEPESTLSPMQVDEAMDSIYARGDRIIKIFTMLHAALAVAMAFAYGTWFITLIVAGAATAMFFISVTLLPRTFITRCIAGIALQTFVALHIYQLHGLAEMHFFFFTAFTMLIVYQDWKSMWPGTILIILQHTMFAGLHNAGVNLYFFEDRYIGITKLFFHFSLVAAQVALAGYWAHLLRQSTLRDALKKMHLQEAIELQKEARKEAELHSKAAEAARHEADVARTEAERANNAKSEFLSRMSHELRTPLNAILGFGQLLETSPDLDEEKREFAGFVVGGGQHLMALINEILDVSRVEAGQLKVDKEPVAVWEVVRESLDLVRPLASERGIRIDAVSLEKSDMHVLADRQKFKQVLLNLLSNAIKYNREGGRIKLDCQNFGTQLRIRVTDTGKGMSSADLGKLFVPFERLGAVNTSIEGTGLGLALSKRLIEVMDGAIGVKSVEGEGSTFFIELPIVDEVPSQAVAPPASEVVATFDEAIATGTVLYIEDNATNFQLVNSILARRPYVRLLHAADGRSGLEMAQQHQPNLILLDVHLPDIMGAVVLQSLQSDARTREIPVVVLSADATRAQVDNMMREGVTAYLTKPLNAVKLLHLLDELLAATEEGTFRKANTNGKPHDVEGRQIQHELLTARLRH